MDKEKKIIEIRKVLLKHTNEVDNWNDAIFEQDFDELVDDLFALHDVVVPKGTLTKKHTNASYLNAREMTYVDYVQWWDEQF